ncbi:UNVERIFIED_CONTAM: hypothetical protein FKN15_008199 [Acipenser sinensis]
MLGVHNLGAQASIDGDTLRDETSQPVVLVAEMPATEGDQAADGDLVDMASDAEDGSAGSGEEQMPRSSLTSQPAKNYTH